MPIDHDTVSPKLLQSIDLVGRAFEIEVDDSYLDKVRDFAEAPFRGLCSDAQKYIERGRHQLTSALHAYDEADDKPLWRDYLDASYAELFLGVTPKAIEPVESCYLNDERVLYATQFFQVKEVMDQNGFVIPSCFKEPADHIAMEWMFFSELLHAGKYEAAADFKKKHMDTWVITACDDLIDRDDVGFYTGIANLAKGIMYELS